jgi:hypothetical protein
MKTLQPIFLVSFVLFLFLPTTIVWGTEDSWTTLESMPTARSGLGVALVNGKI